MKQMFEGFLLAIQFLTTIPLHKNIPWDELRAKWSVRFFSLIGLIAGLLSVLQIFLLTEYTPFSTLMIAFWILFFGVLFSGGLHLDGWMDMSDAVFSYRDRERKLEIMSDSRVGAFGVISLVFLLGFRFLFIYEVLQFSTSSQLLLICLIPFLAKAAVSALLINGTPAKPTGMAAAYKGFLSRRDLLFINSVVVVVALIVVLFLDVTTPVLVLIIACSFLYWLAQVFFNWQFGGITGDMLGALAEGEETFLWFVLWLLHCYAMV